MDRVGGRVTEQPEEIWRGRFQPHMQCGRIDRVDRELIGLELARGDRVGVCNRRKDFRIVGTRCRVRRTAQPGDKIISGYRIAIRPAAIAAQMEDIVETVSADVPALRCAGNDLAVRRYGSRRILASDTPSAFCGSSVAGSVPLPARSTEVPASAIAVVSNKSAATEVFEA